jgi:hypothetical protein
MMMIAMFMVAVIVPLAFVCALVDSALGVDSLARRIEQCRAKERFRHNLAVGNNVSRCPGVKRDKLQLQVLDRLRRGRYPIQQLTMVVMGPRFRVDDAGYGASF